MSFLGLFKNKKDFDYLHQIIVGHEAEAKKSLERNHPHVVPFFLKHAINLRAIRSKKARTLAAASVLGAFLAFPHLLGKPIYQEKPLGENSYKSVSTKISSVTGDTHQNASRQTSNHFNVNGSKSTSVTPTSHEPNYGHQGHIKGKSYLAPPKENGLHDLGYHVGEQKNKQIYFQGPHPVKPENKGEI